MHGDVGGVRSRRRVAAGGAAARCIRAMLLAVYVVVVGQATGGATAGVFVVIEARLHGVFAGVLAA